MDVLIGIVCRQFNDKKTGSPVEYARLYVQQDLPEDGWCAGTVVSEEKADVRYVKEKLLPQLDKYLNKPCYIGRDRNGRVDRIDVLE